MRDARCYYKINTKLVILTITSKAKQENIAASKTDAQNCTLNLPVQGVHPGNSVAGFGCMKSPFPP